MGAAGAVVVHQLPEAGAVFVGAPPAGRAALEVNEVIRSLNRIGHGDRNRVFGGHMLVIERYRLQRVSLIQALRCVPFVSVWLAVIGAQLDIVSVEEHLQNRAVAV